MSDAIATLLAEGVVGSFVVEVVLDHRK